MKRFVLPLVVLVLAAAGAYLLLRGHARQPATFLPAGTLVYEDMPDIFRTVQRWPKTALAQIINEPEVQAFLERPLGLLPGGADLAGIMGQAQSIQPRQVFLAVTDWSGNGAPKTIAGLAYSGSKSDLDALVGQLRKMVQEKWPEGKSDIETYGSGEIETFTTPTFSAALAYRGKWLFIATDTALLKSTLDRYEAKPGSDSLAELPAYKTCIQHLPAAPDNLFFVQPALLSDRAATLELMLNPTADVHGMDSLKKIDAVGIATAMDGEVMRDASFTVTSQPGVDTPLAMDALRVSSPDTIIATSGRTDVLGAAQLPDPKSDPTGVLQLIASDLQIFTGQGLGPAQLSQAFGPEMGFVLDWPAGALSAPAPLVVADVRDTGEARKFLDTLATIPLAAGISFSRQDADGVSLYSLPKSESLLAPPLQVTLGLSGKCIVGALTPDAAEHALKQWDANATGLAGTDAYKKAAALVQPPTTSFTYLDTKAIFEHVYGLVSGVAAMGLIPHIADYVDVAKMPTTDTISRHLGPMVASGSVKDGGLLVESAGPVTMTQAVMVTAISAGAAAVPLIEAELQGQSVTIPGFPGLSPGSGTPGTSPFANPLNQGGSTVPQFQPAPPVPGGSGPAGSPSAGTP